MRNSHNSNKQAAVIVHLWEGERTREPRALRYNIANSRLISMVYRGRVSTTVVPQPSRL